MSARIHFRRSIATALAIALGVAASASALAAPGEVTSLAWCSGTKNCLQWNAVGGATQYHVYRGGRVSLSCLLNPAFDSCNDGNFPSTSTGSTLTDVPAAGALYWFLVTAADGSGEGTTGAATAAPRDSEHGGTCAGACLASGAPCSVSADCCSASCIAGTCQTACCALNGALCTQNGDCCNGSCSQGLCHQALCGDGVVAAGEQCDDGNTFSGDGCSATCTGEPGYYCVGSPSSCQHCPAGRANCNLDEADACESNLAIDAQNCGACGLACGGAPGAAGVCVNSVCSIACLAGHSNCNGNLGDGCECTGNVCCSGACPPPHINGLGQTFDDCTPSGSPGTPSTYSQTMADEARAAWPFVGADSDGICGTGTATNAVFRQTATSCAVWQFARANAGHVLLNTASNACLCPQSTDPVWY